MDPSDFKGRNLLDPTDKLYTVSWPATFFVAVFSTDRKSPGKFTIRYSFEDNEPDLKPGVPEVIQVITIVKITEIIEVEEIVNERYNLMWVYVACGVGTPVVTFLICSLCRKCRK